MHLADRDYLGGTPEVGYVVIAIRKCNVSKAYRGETMENISEPEDTHKIEAINDKHEFLSFIRKNPKGILCVPENVTKQSSHNVVMPQTYDFAKWIRKNKKDITINVARSKGAKSLHSNDFWMPIVFLASDVSVQVFLGLVSNYIYDRIKGALKHDKATVHVKAYYKETAEGVAKEFSYEGSVEGLEEVAKNFDLNKFLG